MYHQVYQRVYQHPSCPVQAGSKEPVAVSPYLGPAWVARGLDSLRSSAPCPSPVPCPSAPCVAGHGRSLLLATGEGQGPRPLQPGSLALARPLRAVKLAPSTIPSPSAAQGGAGVGDLVRLFGGAFIRVPFPAMAEWIHRIFPKKRSELEFAPFFYDTVDGIEPIKTITRNRFRIRVFRCKEDACEDCGRKLHWLSLDLRLDDEWESILVLDERNVQHVFWALMDLFEFLKHEEKNASVPHRSADSLEVV